MDSQIPSEEKDAYTSAIEKLKDAGWQFSRERDGQDIKAFEYKDIDKTRFKDLARRCVGCRLTSSEVEALSTVLDPTNKGVYDGFEFLSLFTRLRFEVKNKFIMNRLRKEYEKRQAMKEEELKKQTRIYNNLYKTDINFNFTEEDKNNAFQKLIEAAVMHDNLKPGSIELQAFEAEYLHPYIFKEQLIRLFSVRFTASELGAMVKEFSMTNEDPSKSFTSETEDPPMLNDSSTMENHYVNCAKFLLWFFRSGFEERSRIMYEKRLETKKTQETREKQQREAMALAESKVLSDSITLSFSEDDKKAAIEKLQLASKYYDRNNPIALPVDTFEVAHMPRIIFRDKLKTVFNLRLSPAELGALVHMYDNGKIQEIRVLNVNIHL